MQSTSKKMLSDIQDIRKSLNRDFETANDGYSRKMFRFAAVAEEDLQEVRDGIVGAEQALRDVQTYFGEGEEMGRPIQSQDFFGIFRTFTTSYKVSQLSRTCSRTLADDP
jgi:cytokinesis protein